MLSMLSRGCASSWKPSAVLVVYIGPHKVSFKLDNGAEELLGFTPIVYNTATLNEFSVVTSRILARTKLITRDRQVNVALHVVNAMLVSFPHTLVTEVDLLLELSHCYPLCSRSFRGELRSRD